MYPRWMYVSNIVNSNGTRVLVMKVGNGKFWDEDDRGWKYATPVNP